MSRWTLRVCGKSFDWSMSWCNFSRLAKMSIVLFPIIVPLLILEIFKENPNFVLCISLSLHCMFWATIHWLLTFKDFSKIFIVPACFEDKNDDHNIKYSQSNKTETKHLSTSECSDETGMNRLATCECYSCVSIDSNSHANISSKNRSHWSSKVRSSCIWEVSWCSIHAHFKEINCRSKNNGKTARPNG